MLFLSIIPKRTSSNFQLTNTSSLPSPPCQQKPCPCPWSFPRHQLLPWNMLCFPPYRVQVYTVIVKYEIWGCPYFLPFPPASAHCCLSGRSPQKWWNRLWHKQPAHNTELGADSVVLMHVVYSGTAAAHGSLVSHVTVGDFQDNISICFPNNIIELWCVLQCLKQIFTQIIAKPKYTPTSTLFST